MARAANRARGWHNAATAPCNQELELRILEDNVVRRLEYPCLQNNEGRWINVDLGTELHIQPLQWRTWRRRRSPQPHHELVSLRRKPPLHPDLRKDDNAAVRDKRE